MRIALFAAVALALVAVAPPAFAADDGIHVDPGSPAGKEYALPLDQARREAKGGDSSSSGDSHGKRGPTALFGEGIKARPSAAGSAGSGGEQGGSGSQAKPHPREKTRRRKVAARLSVPASSSDSSIGFTGALIALTVLLAAGGLGLLLRRVLR